MRKDQKFVMASSTRAKAMFVRQLEAASSGAAACQSEVTRFWSHHASTFAASRCFHAVHYSSLSNPTMRLPVERPRAASAHSDFFSKCCHMIRTPVGALLGSRSEHGLLPHEMEPVFVAFLICMLKLLKRRLPLLQPGLHRSLKISAL